MPNNNNNWAVVIGIDKYWAKQACLDGAVSDAWRMKEWLLNPAGGNVPEENLFLVLSPRSNFRGIDKATQARLKASGLLITPATRLNIQGAIGLVEQQYGGDGDKFYFHFSGHGLNHITQRIENSAIVPSDIKPDIAGHFDTGVLIDLSTLVEYLKMLNFKEQFFFIDACRNIPWRKEFWNGKFKAGEFSGTRNVDPERPPDPLPNQIIFYATSPGLLANEIKLKKMEVGAFTESLLEGLSERINSAKVYMAGSDEYHVTDASLFRYVREEVEKRRLRANEDEREIIQRPTRKVEGGDGTVILTFSSKAFKETNLDVSLDPKKARSKASIAVFLADRVIKRKNRPEFLPVNFKLKPREYGLVVTAANYEPEFERKTIHLYSPVRTTVKLKPPTDPAKSIESLLPSRPRRLRITKSMKYTYAVRKKAKANVKLAWRERDYSFKEREHAVRKKTRVKLVVHCSDEAAALEIADSTGKILATGSSPLKREYPPGFYQTRLVGPEGQISVRDVILTQGKPETVDLVPPEPPKTDLRGDIIERANFTVRHDQNNENLLEVSEYFVGKIAFPQMSTILSLACTASTFDHSQWHARRLRQIGMLTFSEAALSSNQMRPEESGLQTLFAFDSRFESEVKRNTDQTRIRLSHLEGEESDARRLESVSGMPGLAAYTQAIQPGNYRLSILLPDQEPFHFYLTFLPGRLTLFVFHQKTSGEIRVFQYMPKIKNSDAEREARFTRRLDLLQRFYASGSLDHAFNSAKEMLLHKWEDPIFGCISGYLMIRLGKVNYLSQAASNMVEFYPQLPDSHLLSAELLASTGKYDDAIDAYKRALGVGIPIFSDGLTLLSEAITRHKLTHRRSSLLKSIIDTRLKGLLWSANQS